MKDAGELECLLRIYEPMKPSGTPTRRELTMIPFESSGLKFVAHKRIAPTTSSRKATLETTKAGCNNRTDGVTSDSSAHSDRIDD
jgi:hypothetical protein